MFVSFSEVSGLTLRCCGIVIFFVSLRKKLVLFPQKGFLFQISNSMFQRSTWFQIFKYSVYLALITNVVLFLIREMQSASHRYDSITSVSAFFEAYTSTVDTAAWVVLLLLFELETYIIPSEKLKGAIIWIFRLIRALCYTVIVSSFLGYCSNLLWMANFDAIQINSICDLIDKSWMIELDEFKKITAKNCSKLADSSDFFKYAGQEIYTDSVFYSSAYRLAWVDLLNSLSWILVVVMLEIDVWLQLKNRLSDRIFRTSRNIKYFLYTVLFFAAAYWGIFGKFLDFWDAFLWIVAFFFIEQNIVEWKKETDELELLNGR